MLRIRKQFKAVLLRSKYDFILSKQSLFTQSKTTCAIAYCNSEKNIRSPPLVTTLHKRISSRRLDDRLSTDKMPDKTRKLRYPYALNTSEIRIRALTFEEIHHPLKQHLLFY